MSDNSLKSIIPIALEYYDTKREKYNKYFSNDYKVNFLDDKNKTVTFYNKKTKKIELKGTYDEIGYFYNKLKIWYWAWVHLQRDSKIAKEILNYGLKIELKNEKISEIYYYIKNQLINSRTIIRHNLDLEILLAISTYLVKDKFDFIYKMKEELSNDSDNYITSYRFIKIN
tara:strand:+ start:382 stop:894 length:513 start_codon:yes stop_codon:yes gene_type:complete